MAYTQDELRTLAGQGVLRTQIGRATINAKGDPLTVGIALERLYNGSSAQSAQIVALTSMVTVLSGVVADGKHGLSPAQVEKILQDGMREGLKGFSVTLVADERP